MFFELRRAFFFTLTCAAKWSCESFCKCSKRITCLALGWSRFKHFQGPHITLISGALYVERLVFKRCLRFRYGALALAGNLFPFVDQLKAETFFVLWTSKNRRHLVYKFFSRLFLHWNALYLAIGCAWRGYLNRPQGCWRLVLRYFASTIAIQLKLKILLN